jgi:hypothetical protein
MKYAGAPGLSRLELVGGVRSALGIVQPKDAALHALMK